jgi:hypothetical protein
MGTKRKNALDKRTPTSFITPVIFPLVDIFEVSISKFRVDIFSASGRIQKEGGEVTQSTIASRDPGF